MAQITANDLKTRGIAAIEAALVDGRVEVLVSVRGADRYVIMDVARYQYLRECELEVALAETRVDIAAGRFVIESPAEHVARLKGMIAAEAAQPVKAVPRKRLADRANRVRREEKSLP